MKTLCLFAIILFTANVAHAQWLACNNGLQGTNIQAIEIRGTNIFAGSNGFGVFLSTNEGMSWTAMNSGLTDLNVLSLEVSGEKYFAGTRTGGIFLSTDYGTSWSAVNSGLTTKNVWALAVSGTNIFAATWGGGVFLSTNYGTSWTPVNSGLTKLKIICLAVNGTTIYAGTSGGGVFRSSDNGTTWSLSGLAGAIVNSVVVSGSNVYAGTQEAGGVSVSTDNGITWTAVNSGLTTKWVIDLAVSGNNMFAATWGGGVFLSTDNGTSWSSVNTGLTELNILRIATSDQTAFSGSNSSGVWGRPLSEIVTDIDDNLHQTPAGFVLKQNYPNPCSETTSIDYIVPTGSHVTLTVYDIYSRRVASLVSEYKTAGRHSAAFHAGDLPGGTYIYRLESAGTSISRTLTLMK
ncbi:MAG: T9SS type A sorting domain-containing protein [Bacteroidota bacterium]|jgi:photosystem II stability/assembly factor-like uncharacterized protein